MEKTSAETVEIAYEIPTEPSQDLRGNVIRGCQKLSVGDRLASGAKGQSKIAQFCPTGRPEQDIRRLEISVDDSFFMCGSQSLKHLENDRKRIQLTERLSAHDEVVKRSPPHPLHAEPGTLDVLLEKMHFHDPWMVDQGGKGRLIAKMDKLLLVSGVLSLEYLEGELFT